MNNKQKKGLKTAKKLLALILSTGILISVSPRARATVERAEKLITYRSIAIVLDGEELVPTDALGRSTEPFIMDGSTYLPVRALAGALGLEVSWDPETGCVSLQSGGSSSVGGESIPGRHESRYALLTFRSIAIVLDGETLSLKNALGDAVEPFIMGDSTYVPLRAIARAFGLGVEWIASENTVSLTSLGYREKRVTETLCGEADGSNVLTRKETVTRIYPEKTEIQVFSGGNLLSGSIELRNSEGLATEISHYDATGALSARESFTYQDGQLTMSVYDDMSGSEGDSCTLYEYKNGALSRSRRFDGDTVPRVHSTDTKYTYDETGRVIKLYIHLPMGSWDETVYEYGDSGELLSEKRTIYDILAGNLYYSWVYYTYGNSLLTESRTVGSVTSYHYSPSGVLEKTVKAKSDGTFLITQYG